MQGRYLVSGRTPLQWVQSIQFLPVPTQVKLPACSILALFLWEYRCIQQVIATAEQLLNPTSAQVDIHQWQVQAQVVVEVSIRSVHRRAKMPVVEPQRKLLVVEDLLVSPITFIILAIIVRHRDQRHTNLVYHMAIIQVFNRLTIWHITFWVTFLWF